MIEDRPAYVGLWFNGARQWDSMSIQINLRRLRPPVVAEIRKPGKTINFYKRTRRDVIILENFVF